MNSCSQYLTRAIRSCRFVAEAARFCFRVKAEARQKAGFGAIGAG
jgi:hypothetical protein